MVSIIRRRCNGIEDIIQSMSGLRLAELKEKERMQEIEAMLGGLTLYPPHEDSGRLGINRLM
jgi:hypothetical protein